jgi:hypothetical protein
MSGRKLRLKAGFWGFRKKTARKLRLYFSDRTNLAALSTNPDLTHRGGLRWMLTWLFVHLMYIVEFQNRVMVFIQWGFEYLTFSRGARLITGTAATDSIKQAGSVRGSGECP